jgi:hypothetical protein
MNGMIKPCLSLLAIGLLFKLGYQKGFQQDAGAVLPKTKSNGSLGRYAPANFVHPSAGRASFFVNGIPAEVNLYVTPTAIEREAGQFESKWAAKGYKTTQQVLGDMKILSAVDERTNCFNLALMIPEPATQQTCVIPATLDLSKPPAPSRYRTPIYPNAQTVFHIESNDLAGYAENLILLSEASAPQIVSYYQNTLAQQGWQFTASPEKALSAPNSEVMLFTKGADERWLNVTPMNGENKTFIFLLYTDRY